MPKQRQTLDELAQERLPKHINKAIDGIEIRVVIQGSWFHCAANRTRCEMNLVLNWGKVATLVLSLLKIWK